MSELLQKYAGLKATTLHIWSIGVGTLAGGAGGTVSDSLNWFSPVMVAALCASLSTLLIGLVDRAIKYITESRLSAERIATIMSAERQDYSRRQDEMRIEQREYYRSIMHDYSRMAGSPNAALLAEIQQQLKVDEPKSD